MSDFHRGASVLANYRTLKTGRLMTVDFTRTIGGVSSAIYFVSPGSPSDRERMVLSWSASDHCIYDYTNTLVTADVPYWCLANNPSLHKFVKQKLENAGVHDSSRFFLAPVEGAGEMVAFKYTGGTPKHIIFPVGSEAVNWLTMVRSSLEMGSIISGHTGVENILGRAYCDEETEKVECREARRRILAHKRARIWRALDFIEEACQRGGMLHYNPLSTGTVKFRSEVTSTDIKAKHDHNLLFLGDSFSKESVLFADIVIGGRTSDFWCALSAIVKYKGLDSDEKSGAWKTDNTTEDDLEWRHSLSQSTDEQGYRMPFRNKSRPGERILLDAIRAHIGGSKLESVMSFVHNVLTQEQRDVLGNLTNSPASRSALADALLYAPARILIWTLLYSLLSVIKFNVLHLLGYEAHRQLIFKLFMPAVIAIFLRENCLSDTFAHGALNLQLLREKAGGQTVANILNRTSFPISMAVGSREPPRNYCQFDPASLSGELNASASIPFAVNLVGVFSKVAQEIDKLEVLVSRAIDIFEAKSKVAADNRKVRQSVLAVANRYARKKFKPCTDGQEENSNEDGDEDGPNAFVTALQKLDPMYGGRLPRDKIPYVSVENEHRNTTLRTIQEKITARYKHCCNFIEGGSPLINDVAFAGATIKLIFNLFDQAFGLRPRSTAYSLHLNERTGVGMFKHPTANTEEESMMRDAILLENKPSAIDVKDEFDLSDPKAMHNRFMELLWDPPTMIGIKDYAVAERVLQNELMVTNLSLNPIFASLFNAKGLLERVIILINIVKYMNAATICLVDGDLPTLLETRKGVKRIMTKGDKPTFYYRKAGSTPVGILRDRLLPPCIAGLKSISARVEGGRHGAGGRQRCGHAFCRSLRFLFYFIKPDSAHLSLIDAASDVTLLGLADFCSLKSSRGNWYRLIDPVVKGTKKWTAEGHYSALPSEGDTDGRGPKDFFYTIRTAFIDESIVSEDGSVGPDEQIINQKREMLQLRSEGFRRESFNTSELYADVEENRWRSAVTDEIKRYYTDLYIDGDEDQPDETMSGARDVARAEELSFERIFNEEKAMSGARDVARAEEFNFDQIMAEHGDVEQQEKVSVEALESYFNEIVEQHPDFASLRTVK